MPQLVVKRILLASLLIMLCPFALAIDIDRPEVEHFIEQMVEKHSFDRKAIVSVLTNAKSQQSILEAISRPAERTKEWHEYRDIFVTPERIQAGVDFWRNNKNDLKRISKNTGVPEEIIVGIIGVETYFGRITGNYRVIDALATLAFDYPPRSSFFTRELEEFLLLAREESMEPTSATGSYAGAMGRPQFMPSSYRAYAVDSTNDGKRDIWTNWTDVIGSIANYLVQHRWIANKPIVTKAILGNRWKGPTPANSLTAAETVASLSHQGVLFSTELGADEKSQLLTLMGAHDEEYWVAFHNFFVITRYNRSVMYALAVYQVGESISQEMKRGGS